MDVMEDEEYWAELGRRGQEAYAEYVAEFGPVPQEVLDEVDRWIDEDGEAQRRRRGE